MDKETITELYQSMILDHSRTPRNFGKLECTCLSHNGKNASCGDEIELFIEIDSAIIKNIKFIGEGCALSMASTSMMTQLIKNKTIEESIIIINAFINFILHDNIELNENYEPIHIFENIKNFPSRVKCVLLAWRTLEFLLIQQTGTIND